MKTGFLILLASSSLGAGLLVSAPQNREGKPIEGNLLNVGHTFTGLKGVALDGKEVTVPVAGAKGTVIAFSSVTCPLCQKLEPTLASLEDSYSDRGVKFVFLNPSTIESAGEMKQLVQRLKLDGPYVHDPKGTWTKALTAKTTTETFLLDPSGKLIYRGAIDDQYAIGAALPAPKNRYLANAIDAMLAGKPVPVAVTEAPGCLLNTEPLPMEDATPTYHGQIQHIIQRSCLPCHRPDGVAPFSLDSYEAVKGRASMLRYVIDEGIMPPWFATEGGPWRNDMSIPDEDKAALKAWIEGGTPKGDPQQAPTPIKFESGWTIGKPDAVFQLPEPVAIKESGVMPYVNVNVPTNFTEDKWVDRIEVIPGDRRAVHHVLVFIRTEETANLNRREQVANQDARDELGGFFGIYVPGNSALVYPDGLAKRIPKGAILRFQLHYTPYGQASKDQTKIGFRFAREVPKSEVHTASVANVRIAIPPGADDHKVEAEIQVPTEVELLSFLPHMHVRAKAAKYELTAGGKTTTLLDVPRYDFNWQLNYVLAEPRTVKAGEALRFTAWYDNSENNPANPDPTKTVRWGSQTFDEMHLGYIEYIIPGEKPGEGGAGIRRGPGARAAAAGVEATFRRLDRNSDGVVTESEAGLMWNRIQAADANGDGKLTLEEALKYFGGRRR